MLPQQRETPIKEGKSEEGGFVDADEIVVVVAVVVIVFTARLLLSVTMDSFVLLLRSLSTLLV